ncbi:unnamed protein product [Ambrosiozyma monospora]|uniref:Unnamed protein product n=1 Tax=Ambrosiozyma monospora TaxID=43982 RepID=A0A9W7DJE9_AMBMO|nr:unnamed protein product [Ambrosiozyma monospora]
MTYTNYYPPITKVIPILVPLPLELQSMVWQKVILYNLSSSQVCELIGMNQMLDDLLVSIFTDCEIQFDFVRGCCLLPKDREIAFISKEVPSYLPLQSDLFKRMVHFFVTKKVKVGKIQLIIFGSPQVYPVKELDQLLKCSDQFHIEQRSSIINYNAYSNFFQEATSCSMQDYFNCFHLLDKASKLILLDINWYGNYDDKPEAIQKLMKWVSLKNINAKKVKLLENLDHLSPSEQALVIQKRNQKKLIIRLSIFNKVPSYMLRLLYELKKLGIDLQLILQGADERIVRQMNLLKDNICELRWGFGEQEKENVTWIDDVNNMKNLTKLQLEWGRDFESTTTGPLFNIQNPSIKDLELFHLSNELANRFTISSQLKSIYLILYFGQCQH